MINVNQITAQLARMPDQALQQFAAMHKTDPYTLSLALSESNRRKQMRQGAQMQQQPQPKVVDQELAEMAQPQAMPEDVGIGQLPAPNMQGMAAGGIVAFDEGGEVPRFQVGGQPQGYSHGMVDPSGLFGVHPESLAYDQARVEEILARKQAAERAARIKFLETAAPETAQRMKQEDAARLQQPTAPAMPAPSAAPAAPAPGATPAGGIRPTAGIQGLNPAAGGQGLMAGIPGLTQTATGTAQEFQNMREQFGQPTVSQAVKDQISEYQKAREADTTAALEELKADQAKQGVGMETAEKRAKERGEKLSKREADLPGLAIFQAGLAIMSGESPHGLVNIGKGAGVGAKAYTEGLDKLEASREKLDEAFDKIDMFRQNRADMNAKEIRAAQKDIRATKTEAEKLGLDALIEDGKMNRADARVAFGTMSENRAKMYDITAKERLGLAQIASQERVHSMPGAQERMFSKLGGGDLGKGLKAYADIMGPEAKGEWSILQKYAGPQGEMALKIMEAEGPEGRLRAQQIRAKLQSALLTPVNVESARP